MAKPSGKWSVSKLAENNGTLHIGVHSLLAVCNANNCRVVTAEVTQLSK